MAILLLRDSDRGDANDWRRGDVVQVLDDDHPVQLPPAEPFYLIKITGLAKQRAEDFLVEDRDGDTLRRRRLWGIAAADIPTQMRNFLLNNRFGGFGSEPYRSQFPEITALQNDRVLNWTTVRDWIRNKVTSQTATE